MAIFTRKYYTQSGTNNVNYGYTYRSTVAVILSAENRNEATVSGGDEVDVKIELDTEPRIIELPPDFEKALAKSDIARKNFEALSHSKKQWFVIPIKDAKTDETKFKRIEKAINLLIEGKGY